MKKILFISMNLGKCDYGGALVSNGNLFALKALNKYNVYAVSISKNYSDNISKHIEFSILGSKNKVSTALSNLVGYAGRMNFRAMKEVISLIENVKPDIIYLDSSLLGKIAKICKKKYKDIFIITFFHNVEIDFEFARVRAGRIQFLPSLIATSFAEAEAVKNSDKIIMLHQKDSLRLKEKYGREADYFVPVCIKNSVDKKNAKLTFTKKEKDVIRVGFIGTAFFANVDAVKIIANEIAPKVLNIAHFYICGKGFEKYKTLESSNISVSGYIESLDNFYNDIDIMIFPIYSGAGMKVKIAESLMYNKLIIATPFALIGYEKIIDGVNVVQCESSESFIFQLKNTYCRHDSIYSRDAYLKYFSEESCHFYFEKIFNDIEL
ncbi:glycosyltransferase family 4 protein [Salmonella enterica]|nr:glycosyltransferase family 4 protein [Salmonella enterica]